MATLKQQVSRIWGFSAAHNIVESHDDVEYSRGDFVTFISRRQGFYGWAPKYVLILGIKKEYGRYYPTSPTLKYIAKISDYTKPSEFSNHKITEIRLNTFKTCTYKKSIKIVLRNL